MKFSKLLAYLLFSITFITFAQTPKAIETDLVKAFERIDYWYGKQGYTTSDILTAADSLAKANDVFGQNYSIIQVNTHSQLIRNFQDLQTSA